MQIENKILTEKINDLQELCYMCSTKLNANICLLQDEMTKSDIKNDDIVIAIAGLKQVEVYLLQTLLVIKQDFFYFIDS
jgi:hypothetical protein